MPLQTISRLTSPHRSQKTNRQLGAYLAFVAGTINAGGFLAISQYTSHMTGIISSIGDNVALQDVIPVLGAFSMLFSFVIGSMISTIMVSWGRRHKIYSEYALPLLLEALLLLIFGVLGANLNVLTPLTVPTIALMLCFMMGLQNAIITKISKAEIRTTHMTGIVTDIGIELGRLIYWNRSAQGNQVHPVQANQQKLKTHLLIFSMFLIGGAFGAISFKTSGYISVVPISISLIAVSSLQVYRDLRRLIKMFGSYPRI
ncbi:DUF1275 domain-containing protein [Orrella sp. NBD-18]|uniref:DUF1275 domain-containing protein n=1 Tax=Sheuella amnicola TaxID=2707330 RepID=A0A6B2R258_9BURK|nr:YoaK family protein [Sheuella amnicola]NDY84411.1 DUF1275 domain-containing protein [Sheuella amnicola]HBI84103.1 DUF1275 domain-containing protein [Alcaligenaceae bacterium]